MQFFSDYVVLIPGNRLEKSGIIIFICVIEYLKALLTFRLFAYLLSWSRSRDTIFGLTLSLINRLGARLVSDFEFEESVGIRYQV